MEYNQKQTETGKELYPERQGPPLGKIYEFVDFCLKNTPQLVFDSAELKLLEIRSGFGEELKVRGPVLEGWELQKNKSQHLCIKSAQFLADCYTCMHGEDRKGFGTKAAAEGLKKRKGLAVADHREDKAGAGQPNWLL